jgi:hypothetical protein
MPAHGSWRFDIPRQAFEHRGRPEAPATGSKNTTVLTRRAEAFATVGTHALAAGGPRLDLALDFRAFPIHETLRIAHTPTGAI